MSAILKTREVEVVLGAGGGRGLGHVGFLQYLREMQVQVNMYTGASIGALVAAFYTNGYEPARVGEIIRREFGGYGWRGLRALIPPADWTRLRAGGLVNSVPIFEDIVRRYELKPQTNLRIVACPHKSRTAIAFEGTGYNLALALAASCAVPGIIRPVAIDGMLLVDGGVADLNPTRFCSAPALVSCLDHLRAMPGDKLSVFGWIAHLYELRQSRRQAEPPACGRQAMPVHVFVNVGAPDVATATFKLSQRTYARMIQRGYTAARETLGDWHVEN